MLANFAVAFGAWIPSSAPVFSLKAFMVLKRIGMREVCTAFEISLKNRQHRYDELLDLGGIGQPSVEADVNGGEDTKETRPGQELALKLRHLLSVEPEGLQILLKAVPTDRGGLKDIVRPYGGTLSPWRLGSAGRRRHFLWSRLARLPSVSVVARLNAKEHMDRSWL